MSDQSSSLGANASAGSRPSFRLCWRKRGTVKWEHGPELGSLDYARFLRDHSTDEAKAEFEIEVCADGRVVR